MDEEEAWGADMKKIIGLVIAFLFISLNAWGATYYMRADGTAANKGAASGPCGTQANAMSIATHNADTFSAGDIINLCDDGGVFRDQMDIPSSGSGGSPITYQAASGDSPVISGADIPAAWIADDGTTQLISNGSFNSGVTGWAGQSGTLTWESGMIGGRANTAKLVATGTGSVYFEQTGISYQADPVEMTLSYDYYIPSANTDADSTIILQGASTYEAIGGTYSGTDAWNSTGPIAFTQAHADNAVLLIYLADGGNRFNITIGDIMYIDNVSVTYAGAPVANVYNTTVIETPLQVFKDGARLIEGASKAALNDHEWFAFSSTLSMRDDTGDPDGEGYVIEASVRYYNVNTAGYDYVTFSGLAFSQALVNGIQLSAGTTNNIIDNCSVSYAENVGIRGNGATVTDNTISNTLIHHNGASGINLTDGVANILIEKNTVYYNGQIGGTHQKHQFSGGINLWQSGTGNIIQKNKVYRNGYSNLDAAVGGERGYGIWIDNVTDLHTIRYNTVYLNAKSGIFVEITSDSLVYYNIIYSNVLAGIQLSAYNKIAPIERNLIYGNTSYENKYGIYSQGYSDSAAGGCVDNIYKNNIMLGNSTDAIFATNGCENDGTAGSGNVYSNNSLGVESANFINWGGVGKSTYDDWETAYGGTTNSVEADPLFTDAGSDDFTLQPGSPAINAGVDLGNSYDDALAPDSSWPSGVITIRQGIFRGWEIGAYIRPYGRGQAAQQ